MVTELLSQGVNDAFEWVEDMILGGSNESNNAKQYDTDRAFPSQNMQFQQIRPTTDFIVEEIMHILDPVFPTRYCNYCI